ncbi:MAG: hypothetical protein GTO41_22720, partial [Burkholderiales bacterium]|nr:hypothetical protein [Burkholderiales bacterium]
NRFGGGVPDLEERFDGVPYRLGELGCPILEGVLGHLECRIHTAIPAGTHTVFVGQATDFGIQLGKQPLLYWQRRYRTIGSDSV